MDFLLTTKIPFIKCPGTDKTSKRIFEHAFVKLLLRLPLRILMAVITELVT